MTYLNATERVLYTSYEKNITTSAKQDSKQRSTSDEEYIKKENQHNIVRALELADVLKNCEAAGGILYEILFGRWISLVECSYAIWRPTMVKFCARTWAEKSNNVKFE